MDTDTIIKIIQAVVVVASVITGFTKTKVDDTVLGVVKAILARISVLQPKDAPGTLKLPGAAPKEPILFERTGG